MERTIPGIMIAAPKSGSGKTTVTCALLESLNERGLSPRAFKCGPDYIDPMFHRKVIGVPSHNLDSFFSDRRQMQELYASSMNGQGIAIVEGAMGLFDGLGGIREEGSAYHVASILDLPIVLVVDAHGAGRSLLPLLAGFLRYDKEQRINGVILNKTSEHFYRSLAPVIEEELHLPVWGFLPKKQELSLESRHLGLKLPEEICGLQEQIRQAAVLLEKYVRIDAILEAAKRRRVIPLAETAGACAGRDVSHGADAHTACVRKQPTVRIGVARDDAFCFYYEENLNLLEEKGADLVYFSPLEDPKLPDNLDGLLLGGGYPELYAGRLSENASMRDAIKSAITGGMPSAAECGGFLYLHESLTDENGRDFAMCGVIPGRCFYTGKSVRFGYIELVEKETAFLENGAPVKGHEFHYYDSEHNGKSCTAVKPVTAKSWECVHGGGNHFWGFPHLYYPSNPAFAEHLLKEAKVFQKKRKETDKEHGKLISLF